ncbi:hypothetical protein Hypma_002434 [Hypsizygus marmoreus]|uniref:Uncharacterized protein n=1 Tax=Hypsizygus marmoreus TaxID=39966 RepID=A0A369JCY2_HYPMA|nr:hypothetical protein Hypma_002434 [Hypsizygus marmoreus]
MAECLPGLYERLRNVETLCCLLRPFSASHLPRSSSIPQSTPYLTRKGIATLGSSPLQSIQPWPTPLSFLFQLLLTRSSPSHYLFLRWPPPPRLTLTTVPPQLRTTTKDSPLSEDGAFSAVEAPRCTKFRNSRFHRAVLEKLQVQSH